MESKYDFVDTHDVAEQQQHLMPLQQKELAEMLQHYQKLFSGKLGCYPNYQVYLELDTGA